MPRSSRHYASWSWPPLSRITLPDLTPWPDLARTVEQFSNSLRPTLGPIEDWLRRPNAFLAASQQVESLSTTLKAIEGRFRMPVLEEAAVLASRFKASFESLDGWGMQYQRDLEAVMQQMGASSILRVFSDTKHEITSEMRLAACTFLGKAMQPRAPHGSPLAESPLRY